MDRGKRCIFVFPNGALAERLGAGLQNLSQWFDSATHLRNALQIAEGHLFYLWGVIMQNRWRVAFGGGIEARSGWCLVAYGFSYEDSVVLSNFGVALQTFWL